PPRPRRRPHRGHGGGHRGWLPPPDLVPEDLRPLKWQCEPKMAVSTNDLKNGMALDLPEGLMTVVEFQHVKPGKGGAFVRTKLKNFRTGAVLERTFRADEKVPLAVIDKRELQYLYREDENRVFMDTES